MTHLTHRRPGRLIISAWLWLFAGFGLQVSGPLQAATISGTVTDADTGEPVAGVEIREIRDRVPPFATAVTGDGGSYSITVAPGEEIWIYIGPLEAAKQGYLGQINGGHLCLDSLSSLVLNACEPPPNSSLRVAAQSSRTVDFSLIKGERLTVNVVDGNEQAQRSRVVVYDNESLDFLAAGNTSFDGSFSMLLPPGDKGVYVRPFIPNGPARSFSAVSGIQNTLVVDNAEHGTAGVGGLDAQLNRVAVKAKVVKSPAILRVDSPVDLSPELKVFNDAGAWAISGQRKGVMVLNRSNNNGRFIYRQVGIGFLGQLPEQGGLLGSAFVFNAEST